MTARKLVPCENRDPAFFHRPDQVCIKHDLALPSCRELYCFSHGLSVVDRTRENDLAFCYAGIFRHMSVQVMGKQFFEIFPLGRPFLRRHHTASVRFFKGLQ